MKTPLLAIAAAALLFAGNSWAAACSMHTYYSQLAHFHASKDMHLAGGSIQIAGHGMQDADDTLIADAGVDEPAGNTEPQTAGPAPAVADRS